MKTRLPLNAPCQALSYCNKGEFLTEFRPGDFILTQGKGFLPWLIRFGQEFRYNNREFTKWSHVALITSIDGEIIEAQAKGIVVDHISKYTPKEYFVVHIDATDADREQMLAFARACVGSKYGMATFFSIGMSLLTGLKLSFGFDGEEVCSGLVARALERTQAIFPRDASHISPADLASYYLRPS